MKKIIIVFVLFISIANIFAQKNHRYHHVISINPLSYYFSKAILVSYAYKLNTDYEITFYPRIHNKSETWENKSFLGIFLLKDPVSYYKTYSMEVGLRNTYSKRGYVEPVLLYQYAYFKNGRLLTKDLEGSEYDEYQMLNRRYHAIGLIFKIGTNFNIYRFRINLFSGVGTNYRFYKEELLAEKPRRTDIPDNYYPVVSNYNKIKLSFRLGMEIGFKF
ncbi:MAG: hypothetical protein GXO79_03340 [Chlorobi bacterium]|nr:hypothetical protein [Chlorobiota bacterium]